MPGLELNTPGTEAQLRIGYTGVSTYLQLFDEVSLRIRVFPRTQGSTRCDNRIRRLLDGQPPVLTVVDSSATTRMGGKSGLHRAACRLTAGGPATGYGKCNRKYTALCRISVCARGKGEMVRQERTAAGVIPPAWQTPRGARPNRGGGAARPVRLPGRSLEPFSNGRPRGMAAAHSGTETGLQFSNLCRNRVVTSGKFLIYALMHRHSTYKPATPHF